MVKKIPNDQNPGIVAGTKTSNAAMEGSKQQPLGGQRKEKKLQGNVRIPPQNYGTSWRTFATPYMNKKKKGGMKQASMDWKKHKAKIDKKKKKPKKEKKVKK
tara:strand:- start:812 stop:1117 length:306 start_codon:yes stop_codon:yes gene_type:complete